MSLITIEPEPYNGARFIEISDRFFNLNHLKNCFAGAKKYATNEFIMPISWDEGIYL